MHPNRPGTIALECVPGRRSPLRDLQLLAQAGAPTPTGFARCIRGRGSPARNKRSFDYARYRCAITCSAQDDTVSNRKTEDRGGTEEPNCKSNSNSKIKSKINSKSKINYPALANCRLGWGTRRAEYLHSPVSLSISGYNGGTKSWRGPRGGWGNSWRAAQIYVLY